LVIHLIRESLEQDDLEPKQFVNENIPEPLQEFMQDILTPTTFSDAPQEAQLEALYQAVLRLRSRHLTESLDQLKFLQEELQKQGDLRATPYQELTLQQIRARERLDRALNQPLTRD
jgi:hypothetical protein